MTVEACEENVKAWKLASLKQSKQIERITQHMALSRCEGSLQYQHALNAAVEAKVQMSLCVRVAEKELARASKKLLEGRV